MRYWWRELSGWLMIGLGLLCFVVVWQFCQRRWLLEAVPMTFIGMLVFWGGIHLLKVAVAARICQQAQDRLYPKANGRCKPAGANPADERGIHQPAYAGRSPNPSRGS